MRTQKRLHVGSLAPKSVRLRALGPYACGYKSLHLHAYLYTPVPGVLRPAELLALPTADAAVALCTALVREYPVSTL